jgi:hypothetical protein
VYWRGKNEWHCCVELDRPAQDSYAVDDLARPVPTQRNRALLGVLDHRMLRTGEGDRDGVPQGALGEREVGRRRLELVGPPGEVLRQGHRRGSRVKPSTITTVHSAAARRSGSADW